MKVRLLLLSLLFLLPLSCKKGGSYSGSEKGLKKLFNDIKAAHFNRDMKKKAALTRAMLPETSDLEAAFTKKGLKKFNMARFKKDIERFAGTTKQLARLYRIKKANSAYYINKAPTELLASGKHNLPGGMSQAAKYLKPGVTWYRLKFVKPGEKLGMAYTAFAHINNRWIFIPKPWRYFR